MLRDAPLFVLLFVIVFTFLTCKDGGCVDPLDLKACHDMCYPNPVQSYTEKGCACRSHPCGE